MGILFWVYKYGGNDTWTWFEQKLISNLFLEWRYLDYEELYLSYVVILRHLLVGVSTGEKMDGLIERDRAQKKMTAVSRKKTQLRTYTLIWLTNISPSC